MVNLDDLAHLTAEDVHGYHDAILEELPGLPGTKPGMSVEALVGRIHQNLYYTHFKGIEEVAGLYAEVIARGHVFNDGNKRTSLVSMISFLRANGYAVDANRSEIAEWIIKLADGQVTYREFGPWLKIRLRGSLPAGEPA
ncbi:type II toxin-antitoxin system death-on-curing family toxin [Microbulbifer sp.]|uniref:type II toxin-antitoxin system death-on-curing family toxin n=1 Tax=Microbulbifer sp. TaxID=1908541 RepID=UPI003F307188